MRIYFGPTDEASARTLDEMGIENRSMDPKLAKREFERREREKGEAADEPDPRIDADRERGGGKRPAQRREKG